jgi:uncharacterized protein (TIGR03435 family)
MQKLACSLVVFVLGAGTASAQQSAAKKAFEVASVKVAGPLDPQKLLSGQQRVGMKQDAGRVDIENWSLFELLNAAFKVPLSRLTGPEAPTIASVLTGARFDIHATLPAGATPEDVPEMLQSLLAERWKLAYHIEKREQQVYALVVGKDGPKLEPSPPDPAPEASANATNRPDPIQVSGDPQKGMVVRAGQAGAMKLNMTADGIRMENEKLTLEQLADTLTQFVGRPVVDQTRLKGTYKIAIEMSREDALAAGRALGVGGAAAGPGQPGAPAGGASDPSGGTSAFRSVEKMGLKLESKKAPIDYMVIDKLEKVPTED